MTEDEGAARGDVVPAAGVRLQPDARVSARANLDLGQRGHVDDPGSLVLLLTGYRDGDEPAVSLLEDGATLTLRAVDRGAGERFARLCIDGKERVRQDFTFSPAGS